jgi:hypothetical protein
MLSLPTEGTVESGNEARSKTLPKGFTNRIQAVFELSFGIP